jgi:carbonic anhydrase
VRGRQGAIAEAELGNLTQLLAKIRPAVGQTSFTGKCTADNPEFVDAVARKSVELTMARLRKGSAVIADLEKSGAVKVVGCFYDLSTGKIDFLG